MPDKKIPDPKPIERCEEHHPLVNCVNRMIYEVRELIAEISQIKTMIRSHDDKVVDFYEILAQVSAQLKTNNDLMAKTIGMLNDTSLREAKTAGHLEEILALLAKNMGNNKEDWFCKQLELYQKAQTKALTDAQKANAKLMWKLVGVIITLALFIAGVTGNINI